jgi:hypothetical protein
MRQLKLTAVVAMCLLGASFPAHAEVSTDGDVITTFDGGFTPTRLPRAEPAPVAVHVAGNVRSASGDGARIPQLRTVTIAINRQGRLFDRGLPVCDVASIQPADEAHALATCGESVVGSGQVTIQAHIPTQPFFEVKARILAFNGPRRHGHKLILAQAYAPDPPGAFVLSFTVKKGRGVFGTVMSTTLPASAQQWAYLTHFALTLRRTYTYNGKTHSYVSAACSAPPGFRSAVFPFGRATYGFDDGRSLTTEIARRCTVRA